MMDVSMNVRLVTGNVLHAMRLLPCSLFLFSAVSPLMSIGQTTEQKVAEWMQSVVKITQAGRNGDEGMGAGWVVDGSGLIVTNFHVIGRGRKLEVSTKDGRKLEVTGIHAWDQRTDLAILKVAATDLIALKLADVKTAKPGHPVTAIGNPEGLEFSVVEGVVSATREIEEQEMIQVALPIERGNSGGPLLNRKGAVLGVLTLKSMRAENLGFAMPVTEVKRLLEEPNPVPIKRWLTLGVLDDRTWKVAKAGADWSQRAGVIRCEGLGAGFGGRTLVLARAAPPAVPYEVGVKVKLGDESGAAGLAFCSDEGDRHYGFYPSNGQMRLTRFEGPDVYSWKVLAQESSPAYRSGDWNELRVRVEQGKLTCWVNGVLWRTVEDDGLSGGKVGLCRFRAPSAEFKGFKAATSLENQPLTAQQTEALQKTLQSYLEGKTTVTMALGELGKVEDAAQSKIESEIKSLTERITALKRLETRVHKEAVITELTEMLAKDDNQTSLLKAALLLAKLDNPELDMEPYLALVQRMTDELKADPAIKKGGMAALKRLNAYLFEENGFHMSRDGGNGSSSYINEVLDDREGLPIMLCVIYLELGQRLGISGLHGLGFPGKFMVGWKANTTTAPTQIIDVANEGKVLTLQQAAEEIGLPDADSLNDFMEPSTKREMVLRMCRNLLGEYSEQDPLTDEQAGYVSLQIALVPSAPGERVLRAIYRSRNGDKPGARDDIRWLILNTGDVIGQERLAELQSWYDSLAETPQASE
jgi:serine protease Do